MAIPIDDPCASVGELRQLIADIPDDVAVRDEHDHPVHLVWDSGARLLVVRGTDQGAAPDA